MIEADRDESDPPDPLATSGRRVLDSEEPVDLNLRAAYRHMHLTSRHFSKLLFLSPPPDRTLRYLHPFSATQAETSSLAIFVEHILVRLG